MKRLGIAGVGFSSIAGFTAAANAADLPAQAYKAPPPLVAPMFGP
jgi:hypothetical protein